MFLRGYVILFPLSCEPRAMGTGCGFWSASVLVLAARIGDQGTALCRGGRLQPVEATIQSSVATRLECSTGRRRANCHVVTRFGAKGRRRRGQALFGHTADVPMCTVLAAGHGQPKCILHQSIFALLARSKSKFGPRNLHHQQHVYVVEAKVRP